MFNVIIRDHLKNWREHQVVYIVYSTLQSPFQFPLLSGNKGFKFTAAKRLGRFFLYIQNMILLTMMWKHVQGCMKQLHLHQNNEFHFLENIPPAKKKIHNKPTGFPIFKTFKTKLPQF